MGDVLPGFEVDETTHKTCRLCGELKPLTSFHKAGSPRKHKDGSWSDVTRGECAECRSVHGPAHSGAAGHLMKREGLVRPPLGTPCPICDDGSVKLYCDHDHKTGEFRGFICNSCNTALAKLGDSIEGVMKMVYYLQKSKQQKHHE